MSKGSDLLVAALENEGVERIFGIPGEENLDVVEVAPPFQHRTGHHPPRTGGCSWRPRMVLTGKPGVCLATLGPGANFTTGAAYALLGAWPVIMITGRGHRGQQAGTLPDRRSSAR